MKKISRKEFERIVGTWFVFGVHDNGCVDIATDGNDTLFEEVPQSLANNLCALQNEFYDRAYRMAEYFKFISR